MTETLQATVEARRSGANMVRLSGSLDEHAGLEELLQTGAGRLLIHLGSVTHLNEAGMRAWVSCLATLDAQNVKVDLIACSPQMVQAFNDDAQLARCARVKSVQARYRCAKCKRDEMQLVTIAEVQKANGDAPHRACEKCIGRLVMVEDPARYFEFVAQLPRTSSMTIDPSVVAEIARGSRVKVSVPSQAILPIRPSTLSVMQSVIAKTNARPMTSDRNYIIALVVIVLAIIGGLAALALTL